MDNSRRCSSAIRALADDLNAQAKSRSYAASGRDTPDASEMDRIQTRIEDWAAELEKLSEATLLGVVETDAQGRDIYLKVEAITRQIIADGAVWPNDALISELAHACVPRS